MFEDSDEEDANATPSLKKVKELFTTDKQNSDHHNTLTRHSGHRAQHRWCTLEKEEVSKLLGSYLQMRRRPGKAAIVAAQEKSNLLKLRRWQLIRDYVVNAIRNN